MNQIRFLSGKIDKFFHIHQNSDRFYYVIFRGNKRKSKIYYYYGTYYYKADREIRFSRDKKGALRKPSYYQAKNIIEAIRLRFSDGFEIKLI